MYLLSKGNIRYCLQFSGKGILVPLVKQLPSLQAVCFVKTWSEAVLCFVPKCGDVITKLLICAKIGFFSPSYPAALNRLKGGGKLFGIFYDFYVF